MRTLGQRGQPVGFTLTNGLAPTGGEVDCASASATVSNCVLTGNAGKAGGGACYGTLINCTLTGNLAVGVEERVEEPIRAL